MPGTPCTGRIQLRAFEILSFLWRDYEYYKNPFKNIGCFECPLNNYDWTFTGLTTNLQTPAATEIMVSLEFIYTQPVGPLGQPIYTQPQVYLQLRYDKIDGSVGTKTYGPLTHTYSGPFDSGPKLCYIYIYDNFAPNGQLSIDYKRTSSTPPVPFDEYPVTGRINVYVEKTKDITDGLQRPSLNNPWEYYDWLKNWTLQNTAAPYWRRYWTLGGYGDLRYGNTYPTASPAELALLSLQRAATKQTIKWFLEEAQKKLDDPSYTVEQAAGEGVRVVLYADPNYNSNPDGISPEYILSQTIAYEPESNGAIPFLDDNFYLNDQGDWITIESADLGFMKNKVSSIEVRGANVLLFEQTNFMYTRRLITSDTPDLGNSPIIFNDKTESLSIGIKHPPRLEIADNVVEEGTVFQWGHEFLDPFSTHWDISIDYGDGHTESYARDEPTYDFNHAYADNGVYPVTVTVTDDDGWTTSTRASVTVKNMPPTINPIAATHAPVEIGTMITAKATFNDPGTLDTHTATWSWGDNSDSPGSVDEEHARVTGTHTYLHQGIYTVTLTIYDNDGAHRTQYFKYIAVFDPSASTPPQWLKNPGFENDLHFWSATDDASYTLDNTTYHSGHNSVMGVEAHEGDLGRLYQDLTSVCIPGHTYKISGWIKTAYVVGDVVIALDYVTPGGWCPADGYVQEIGYVTGTRDWTYFESPEFTLPSRMPRDCSSLWFLFDFNNGKGFAWFDDVSLIDVTYVHTYMKFILESPADFLITDPQGRSIGIDPLTGQLVNEIPGGLYSGSNTEPQVVLIPSPIDGEYDVKLLGTASSTYTFTSEFETPTGVTTNTFTGSIVSGEILTSSTVLATHEVDIAAPVRVPQKTQTSKLLMSNYIKTEIQWLKTSVMKMNIKIDVKQGLLDKLNAALLNMDKSISYSSSGNNKQANNMLKASGNVVNAFLNQVKAQGGKAITKADSDALLTDAQNIIYDISKAEKLPLS
jgi:PKD repeat protein